MVQKITYHLHKKERRSMMNNLSYLVQKRLGELRCGVIKHAQLARNIGVPRTRISEAYHRRYINEFLIKKLVAHGYLSPSELFERNLTERQKAVLSFLISSESES